METIKVLRVQEQTEACWKNFKERILTKKNSRENLLLNSDFNSILQALLSEGNGQVTLIALEFIVKCLKSKIISSTALITLIQQKMPHLNASRIISMPLIERVASISLIIEMKTGLSFVFPMASSDPRVIPFFVEKLISGNDLDVSSDFINFLLGDPDLILSESILGDSHYKISRCRLLAHLVKNVRYPQFSDILITYLVWNSSHQCLLEFEFLTPLCEFFPSQYLEEIHFELFDVFLEVLCNLFFKFGCFGELIKVICETCPGRIDQFSAFKIGSLLLMNVYYDEMFALSVLQILSKFDSLNLFSKVCSAHIMKKHYIDENLSAIMKYIFSTSNKVQFPLCMDETKPFTEFGILVHLGFMRIRPNTAENSKYFDLMEIAIGFDRFNELKLENFVESGHFEVLFALLAFDWNSSKNMDSNVKGFLRLLSSVKDEDEEAKILRYSWVVDFFETNFSFEHFLNYLPLICEFVTNNDNILFAFVKQKISQLMNQHKGNISIQLPIISSLFVLFDSSQSRQSRLNFLTTMSLSFLHNSVERIFGEIDTKAIVLAFKLLKKLVGIVVVDPRDIWTKYIEVLFKDDILFGNAYIRGGIFLFVSSFNIIPDGDDGEINLYKFNAIKLLIENLSFETEQFPLDQICESLTCFNLETVRKVQLSLLKPEISDSDKVDVGVEEISFDNLLSNSVIFNPELIYKLSERFVGRNGPSMNYSKLWTKLIDNEVETMPRTKFLGSSEKTHISEVAKVKPISNPSFCNPLIFETFDGVELSSIDDVLKCYRTRFIPIIPSTNTLLWYIRPHLARWLQETSERIFKLIDDDRIKKQLCDYEYLLKNLKNGTSPQSLSGLLMLVSSILRCCFNNNIISENRLFNSWINFLTKRLADSSEFKAMIANEEFLTAFAISSSLLMGCSTEIDAALTASIESMIIQNLKIKDGNAVYAAVEALPKSKLIEIFSEKTISSKRRLVSLLSLQRHGCSVTELFTVSDKPDELELALEIICRGKGSQNLILNDPIDFKGLNTYVQSIIAPEEIRIKSEQRAFDRASIPAALKYDAIFSFILGSGFDLINMNTRKTFNISGLENSTKDPKCLALLQIISSSSNREPQKSSVTSLSGFERFDKLSWLKFIGKISSISRFKFDVLLGCKLLPRIIWSEPIPFDFSLKHVLSITPITKIPFINPSLLSVVLNSSLSQVFNENISVCDMERIVQILYNNSDEKSTVVLLDILNYSFTNNRDDLLEIILKESLKYSQELLKDFPIEKLKTLSPERLVHHSRSLKELFDKLNIQTPLLFQIESGDSKNCFSEIRKILEMEENDFLLRVLSIKLKNLAGKAKIHVSVNIIDLMFIYQQDEIKFNILSKLLHEILFDIDVILLESKTIFSDPEIVNKFKTRSALIPKDIFDKFQSAISSSEFDKLSF